MVIILKEILSGNLGDISQWGHRNANFPGAILTNNPGFCPYVGKGVIPLAIST